MTQKSIYFHIGTPKTGTSAIQAFLALNAELLAKKGFQYPNPPDFSQPYQTSSGNAMFIRELIEDGKSQEIAKILHTYDYSNENKILLSSEHLIKMIHEFPREFFKQIEDFDYKLIVYLRRQDNYQSSRYNQFVKNSDYVESAVNMKFKDHMTMILDFLNYTKSENIIVRPYEKQQFHQGNIFADFLSILGLKLTEEFIFPDRIVNPSFNAEALAFRQLINKQKFDFQNMLLKSKYTNHILADYTVSKNQGEPFQESNAFTLQERLKIIENYSSQSKQIAKFFLKNQKEFFYDPLPSKQPIRKELSLEETIELCLYFLDKTGNIPDYKNAFRKEIKKYYKIPDKNIENIQNNKIYELCLLILKSEEINEVNLKQSLVEILISIILKYNSKIKLAGILNFSFIMPYLLSPQKTVKKIFKKLKKIIEGKNGISD